MTKIILVRHGHVEAYRPNDSAAVPT